MILCFPLQVIHRDLKLGNLFIDDNMNIKIGDFGLATKEEYDGERKRYRALIYGVEAVSCSLNIDLLLARLKNQRAILIVVRLLIYPHDECFHIEEIGSKNGHRICDRLTHDPSVHPGK